MNIEHPIITEINDFGYPKSHWQYELERNGYKLGKNEDKEADHLEEAPISI
ncbi:hypothetical protein [Bacillus sp. NPDC077027]|uniref:hypothetical protein n=1 Tax=Bacillus sp. NPDC077027 TaxID=3390548 RepID=UPI003CFCA4A2